MKDPIAALEWHPGPGAEELVRRKAQLHVLTRRLLERERDLAAYRNELHAFETRYRKALGTRYARLDELAERLDETQERVAGPGGDDHAHGTDGPAERYPGQGLPGGQNWAWGEREPEQEPERRPAVAEGAKRLFRQLARLIHPDLAGDAHERERRTNLMVAANEAYERGDEAALERMLASAWAMRRRVRSSSAAAPRPVTASGLACQSASIRSRAASSPRS